MMSLDEICSIIQTKIPPADLTSEVIDRFEMVSDLSIKPTEFGEMKFLDYRGSLILERMFNLKLIVTVDLLVSLEQKKIVSSRGFEREEWISRACEEIF